MSTGTGSRAAGVVAALAILLLGTVLYQLYGPALDVELPVEPTPAAPIATPSATPAPTPTPSPTPVTPADKRMPDPDRDDIRALVRQIGEIERRLSTICPPGIYQQTGAAFECTTDQIAAIEQKLNALSLWEQVHFFHWLREQYRQRRDQLANAVAQQLVEASTLGTVGGHPFPVAALTQPLKAIAEEVKSTLSAGAMSSRGAIPVPGYTHPTNVFLFMGQYANAWQRLTRLGDC